MNAATARITAGVILIAAGTVLAALLGVTWYEHIASGNERTAWRAVDEVGVDLTLAGVAAAVGLAGLAFGLRLPRVVSLLGVLAALALTVLLAYRLAEPPSLFAATDRYSTESGPLVATVAAAVLLTASLLLVIASAGKREHGQGGVARGPWRSAGLLPAPRRRTDRAR